MNRGFIFYIKRAFKCANKTAGGIIGRAKCLAYVFITLFARLTVVLCAFASLMDVRQAKLARDNNVSLSGTLGGATKKSVGTMIVATLFEALLYLGGLAVLALPCGALVGVGFGISQLLSAEARTAIILVFAAPCAVAFVVYTVVALAAFSSTAYIIDGNPRLSAGEVVSICVATMRRRGKLTAILCRVAPMSALALLLAVFGAGLYAFIALLGGQSYCALLCVSWAVVMAAILFFAAPLLVTAKNLATLYLCEDIALDPATAARRGAGASIKSISGARLDGEAAADGLFGLFDDGLEEKTVGADKLKRKHPDKLRVFTEKEEEQYDLSDIDEYADETAAAEEESFALYDGEEYEDLSDYNDDVYDNE